VIPEQLQHVKWGILDCRNWYWDKTVQQYKLLVFSSMPEFYFMGGKEVNKN